MCGAVPDKRSEGSLVAHTSTNILGWFSAVFCHGVGLGSKVRFISKHCTF